MADFDRELFEKIATRIRYHILTATTHAESGHPTSSLSVVELMTVLLFGNIFHYNTERPEHPNIGCGRLRSVSPAKVPAKHGRFLFYIVCKVTLWYAIIKMLRQPRRTEIWQGHRLYAFFCTGSGGNGQ